MLKSGFTLIELMVVMGIFAILASFTTINLLSVRNQTSRQVQTEVLVSDLKQQQLKSMMGLYSGIVIGTNQYTLVPENFVVSLPDDIKFFSSRNSIWFSTGSGEIRDFLSDKDTISLQDNRGENTKTIRLNKYGAVTNIN